MSHTNGMMDGASEQGGEMETTERQGLLPAENARDYIRTLRAVTVATHYDIHGAAAALKAVRRAIRGLVDVESELERLIDEQWPNALGEQNRAVDVPGVGRVSRSRGQRRKEWDREGLTKIVAAMAPDERLMDPETGEPLESEGECMRRVLTEVFRFEARATPLRKRNIDVDEYSKMGDGKLVIDIFDDEPS